jgi:Fe-S-cluster containining protein
VTAAKKRAAPAVRFPADEARHPWLPALLRLHALVDAGVAAAVREQERSRGVPRACRRGCDVCCRTQSDIPAFPIELTGITWYCVEKLAGAARSAVRENLERHVPGAHTCPFLVEHACAVHAVRPVACRLFTVFGAPCAEEEDPFHARRDDLLAAPPGLLAQAYRVMLPFHGVTEPRDQQTWLERGMVQSLAANLPTCNWNSLARLMERQTAQKGPDARRES